MGLGLEREGRKVFLRNESIAVCSHLFIARQFFGLHSLIYFHLFIPLSDCMVSKEKSIVQRSQCLKYFCGFATSLFWIFWELKGSCCLKGLSFSQWGHNISVWGGVQTSLTQRFTSKPALASVPRYITMALETETYTEKNWKEQKQHRIEETLMATTAEWKTTKTEGTNG